MKELENKVLIELLEAAKGVVALNKNPGKGKNSHTGLKSPTREYMLEEMDAWPRFHKAISEAEDFVYEGPGYEDGEWAEGHAERGLK